MLSGRNQHVTLRQCVITAFHLADVSLTRSMQQEIGFRVSEKVSQALWNPRKCHRVQKYQPQIPNLGKTNPVHILCTASFLFSHLRPGFPIDVYFKVFRSKLASGEAHV
jgi:hypothetical protein